MNKRKTRKRISRIQLDKIKNDDKKFTTFLGVFAAGIAFGGVSTAAILSSNFSWYYSYLSDLGAYFTFQSMLFNGSIVVCGVLAFGFFVNFISDLGIKRNSIVNILFYLTALSLALMGAVPRNVNYLLHGYLAKIFIALAFFSILFLGIHLLKHRKRYALFSIIFVLSAGIICVWSIGPFGGRAISEMLVGIFVLIWLIVSAFYVSYAGDEVKYRHIN